MKKDDVAEVTRRMNVILRETPNIGYSEELIDEGHTVGWRLRLWFKDFQQRHRRRPGIYRELVTRGDYEAIGKIALSISIVFSKHTVFVRSLEKGTFTLDLLRQKTQ